MRDTQRRDLHADITNTIIAAIEANPGEPQMPWYRPNAPFVLPVNALTKNPYNGINIVSLWASSDAFGYQTPLWGTYRQWAELDAQVRKGEKASLVVFYKSYETEPDAQKPDDDGKRRVAKASWVFNVAQVDGYQLEETPPPSNPVERMLRADAFVTETNVEIRYGGSRAYYRPSGDFVQMPDEHLFTGTATSSRSEAYYAVLCHELTHASGAKHRLDRDLSGRFGNEAYAMEELVAELGAAFLCAELGITPEPRLDHAQYIHNWLAVLKSDNRAIFTAAAKASEAVGYLKRITAGEGSHE